MLFPSEGRKINDDDSVLDFEMGVSQLGSKAHSVNTSAATPIKTSFRFPADITIVDFSPFHFAANINNSQFSNCVASSLPPMDTCG